MLASNGLPCAFTTVHDPKYHLYTMRDTGYEIELVRLQVCHLLYPDAWRLYTSSVRRKRIGNGNCWLWIIADRKTARNSCCCTIDSAGLSSRIQAAKLYSMTAAFNSLSSSFSRNSCNRVARRGSRRNCSTTSLACQSCIDFWIITRISQYLCASVSPPHATT